MLMKTFVRHLMDFTITIEICDGWPLLATVVYMHRLGTIFVILSNHLTSKSKQYDKYI